MGRHICPICDRTSDTEALLESHIINCIAQQEQQVVSQKQGKGQDTHGQLLSSPAQNSTGVTTELPSGKGAAEGSRTVRSPPTPIGASSSGNDKLGHHICLNCTKRFNSDRKLEEHMSMCMIEFDEEAAEKRARRNFNSDGTGSGSGKQQKVAAPPAARRPKGASSSAQEVALPAENNNDKSDPSLVPDSSSPLRCPFADHQEAPCASRTFLSVKDLQFHIEASHADGVAPLSSSSPPSTPLPPHTPPSPFSISQKNSAVQDNGAITSTTLTTELVGEEEENHTVRCTICMMDELDVSDVYSFINCGHTFCNECVLDQLFTIARGDAALGEDDGAEKEQGQQHREKKNNKNKRRHFSIICCPLPECKTAVPIWEFKESILPARKRLLASRGTAVGVNEEAEESRLNREFLLAYEAKELEKALTTEAAKGTIASCPGKNCNFKIELPDSGMRLRGEPQLLVCQNKQCRLVSCASCQKSPYHYGTSCEEAGRLQAHFVAVVQQLTPKGLKERSEQVNNYQARLEDEKWKSANCVCCPYCGRVAQHGGGCSHMVCGYTTDGNGQNVGCGKSFNWETAKNETPYKATLPELPKDVGGIAKYTDCKKDRRKELLLTEDNDDEVQRQQQGLILKDGCDWGRPGCCSACRQPILRGTYFECVNCPGQSTLHCLGCLEHLLKNHPKDHYSKVHC